MKEPYAALFDLDGVIIDTESQYTVFWENEGVAITGEPGLAAEIKGMTLTEILRDYFGEYSQFHDRIRSDVDNFEAGMDYQYIPGAVGFVASLLDAGVKTALVTSSNRNKMESLYARRSEIRDLFDIILTAEDFARSKPAPDCYIEAMRLLGTDSSASVVFEDSVNGLRSGKDSGAKIVGLSTTNTPETIKPYCDKIIPDFTVLSVEDFYKLLREDRMEQ